MPPSRKRRESWSEDEAMPKKAKKGAQDAGSSAGSASKDADGNHFWELASKRRVVISEYKGQCMVSIREYYEKDGQALPGKKGISLPVSQFSSLISLLPQIETVVREKGENVARPRYDVDEEVCDGPQESVTLGPGDKESRRNFEETSDEE